MTDALELTLAFASAGSVAVPDLDSDDPRTQTWVDAEGIPSARFSAAGDEFWAWISNVGAYRIGRDGGICAVPDPGASEALVRDGYRRTVVPMALQLFGVQVLHASAVVSPSGVVGFCADARTGKSTIAYALSRYGHRLWADDALAFDLSADQPRALALPFAIRLRPASLDYFATDRVDVPDLGPDGRIVVGGTSEPLAAVCLLTRHTSEDGAVEVRRLAADEIIPELLPHSYCFVLDEERKRPTLDAYLRLAGAVPVYELRFAAGLENLPGLVDAIESTVFAAAVSG